MADETPDLRGHDTAERVNQFEFSLDLFRRNYTELRLFLGYLVSAQVAIPISSERNRWMIHDAMREVGCLLHNFVAAAITLVDHSRVLYRHVYEPTGKIADYAEEVKRRFQLDPLTQFILGLRQMAQHYRLPTIGISLHFEPPSSGSAFRAELQLQKKDLLTFGSWNASAKTYLNAAGDTIDIAAVIQSYHDHVMDFYEWFRSEQRAIHGKMPEVLAYLAQHGIAFPGPAIARQIADKVTELEKIPKDQLTFEQLRDALDPALTVLDDRLLVFCEQSPTLWIETALSAISQRFSLPNELEDRLHALVKA